MDNEPSVGLGIRSMVVVCVVAAAFVDDDEDGDATDPSSMTDNGSGVATATMAMGGCKSS